MRKSHVFVLAVLIAVGSALGTFALTRTTELGVKAREASTKDVDAAVAARTRQLNALEVSIHKAFAKKPPKLPVLPKLKKPQPVQAAPRVYTPAPVASVAPVRAPVARVAAPKPRPAATRTEARQAPAHESDDHASAASGGEQDD
jgi:type IV secretory pathway VirB10-like protein